MSSRLEMICPLRPLSQSLRLCQLPQRGSQGPDRSVLPLPLGEVSPQGTERARTVKERPQKSSVFHAAPLHFTKLCPNGHLRSPSPMRYTINKRNWQKKGIFGKRGLLHENTKNPSVERPSRAGHAAGPAAHRRLCGNGSYPRHLRRKWKQCHLEARFRRYADHFRHRCNGGL